MTGDLLGHYRVTAPIGSGGMGEVYRAVDERLGREVALKLLPPGVASDPERLARFRREAKTLASLSHSGIGAIHGLEEHEGTLFLVLELVEGEDLSGRLERGPLPLAEAVRVGVELATALEAAHERGIVHRDLKPSNIKLGEDGHPKILDFGLAKIYAQKAAGGEALSDSPTLTADASRFGSILGTAGYMAPEQARGERVDKRADIWAFGVVLFEMLTGRPLFAGSSASERLVSVLTQEVDWSRLPPQTPLPVRRVLERCLCRDPHERLRDIGEARIRLQKGFVPNEAAAGPPRASGRGRRALLGAGLALLAGVGGFVAGRSLPREDRTRPAFAAKLDLDVRDLALAHRGQGPKISPGGRELLYSTEGGLRVRRLTEFDEISLPETDGAVYAFWSPDGRSIGYSRKGRLWRMLADGSRATDLGAVPEDLQGSGGGAWDDADRLLLAGSQSLGLVGFSADGRVMGELLRIPEGETDFHEINRLPGSRGFVFTVHGPQGIDTIAALVEGERKDLLHMPGEALRSPQYSRTGHLLFERETTSPGLWAVRFSLTSTEVVGHPFLVIPHGSEPTLADNGTLVFIRRGREKAQLVEVGRDGLVRPRAELPAPAPVDFYLSLSLSPSGRRVAVPLDARPYADLWIIDLERGSQSRLEKGWVGSVRPVWMPDDSRLLYSSLRDSRTQWLAWLGSADGTAEPRRFRPGDDEIAVPLAVSPDGRWLVYGGAWAAETIMALRIDGSGSRQVIARDIGRRPFFVSSADFSPDGAWLAYSTVESGSSAVWIQPFPPDGRRWPVSTGGGNEPRWSPSGSEIFYRSGPRMMAVRFEPASSPTVGRPTELFAVADDSGLSEQFEPLPDGEGFLMLRDRARRRVTAVFDFPSLLLEAESAQRGSP